MLVCSSGVFFCFCMIHVENCVFKAYPSWPISFLFNPFPNKPWFSHVYRKSLLTHSHTITPFDALKIYSCENNARKTMWEKEKLLVTSISPFLTMFSTLYDTYFSLSMHFRMSSAISFNLDQSKIFSSGNGLKTLGKEDIARNEQFLLFPKCFLPILRTFCHFHQTWNCHLQTLPIWKSLEFVVWERVKALLI